MSYIKIMDKVNPMTSLDLPVVHVVMRQAAYCSASALAVFVGQAEADAFVRSVEEQRKKMRVLFMAREIDYTAAKAMMTLDPGCDPSEYVSYFSRQVPLITGPLTEAGLHPWGLAEAKRTVPAMQEPEHFNNALAVALSTAQQKHMTNGSSCT